MIIKTCGCGKFYTQKTWNKLKFAYITCASTYKDYKVGEADEEYKHCICGSTIGILIPCTHKPND